MMTTPTHTQVVRWLIGRVATSLDVQAEQLDPTMPLAELGLDSVAAVGLCGDIEQHWRVEADPTLVYEYPTITDIAGFVTDGLVVEDMGRR